VALTRTTSESIISVLAASVATETPRLIVLSAPAGYGKNAFLRAYERYAGTLNSCDLAVEPESADLARPVLDALIAEDRRRATRFAVDRLAWRADTIAAGSRMTLRREWPIGDDRQLFAVRDVGGRLATPAGMDLFVELVASLPPARTLAVTTRAPLPPAVQNVVGRERAVSLAAEHLALSREAVIDLAIAAGQRPAVGDAIWELAGGWPLVSRLLVRLDIPENGLDETLEAAGVLPKETLLTFAVHRTIASLHALVREALVVAVLLSGATHAQLVRVLGDACDDIVFARLATLPFVVMVGERAVVHSEIAGVLRSRFSSIVKVLYERTLNVLTGEGAYVEAARVALQGGDVERAAAMIDAAPPYTAAPVPLSEYERIIDRLDRSLITRYPNVWIATIPYRSFAVDRRTFVREAETVYYCLPAAAGGDQRAAALMLLASAYFNAGRLVDADRLIEEGLRGFASAPSRVRASLLNMSAWLHGMEGRFTHARAIAEEAAGMWRSSFGENQTLHYIDMHEAAYRGQNERVVVIIDELLRRLENDVLPLHRANTATNGAVVTWANGDDESFQRYVAVLEDAMTPGLERGFAPIIDAARGRPIELDDGYPWPVLAAVAQLFRLENVANGPTDALDAARAAARAADERRDPYTGILAHVALYVLDGGSRAEHAAVLQALAAAVESEELHAAIAALLRGEPAGMLERFIRLRVLRERQSNVPRLTLKLLAGCMLRDGVPVRLSDKEFELLALLGSSHAALSRDRIGEAIWDHLDPEEWPNNLKVTVSRLRSKVGLRDAVVLVDGRYRLSPVVDVDLRRAESVVRESASGGLDDGRRDELRAVLTAYASGTVGRYDRYPWVQPLLARVTEVVCDAGAILAADALARKEYDDALRYAGEIEAIDPFNESACETMIRVFNARGDASAARRVLRRYTEALANELGATPSSRLVELVRSGL
jgi:DNA-binding SARP family transcriptional activator